MRAVLLAALCLAACRNGCDAGDTGDTDTDIGTGDTDTGDTDDTAPSPDPGVIRVGPPAPSVGIYGIAAPPGHGRVYVSNLHVPFLTVLDAPTGDLLDAVDLREGCGDHAFFPRLFVTGDVLWVTQADADRLCRYDFVADAWLEPVEVEGMGGGIVADGADLWVATEDTLLRHDGTGFVESVPAPGRASAIDIEDGVFAVLVGPDRRLFVTERDGTSRWEATVVGEGLNDVALLGGRAYVTDRVSGDVIAVADGAEVGRVTTGSDTFAIERFDDGLYVTNRQGRGLPASGAYQGDPGIVTALDGDLAVRWTGACGKTIHFLAFDGSRALWTANEDELTVCALDPATGDGVRYTDPVGLTVDHLAEADGAWFFGSHLTDEVWRVDPAGDATGVDVCGWPFVTVPVGDELVVPCQEDGRVWTIDLPTLTVNDRRPVADTFAPACPGGLCTGHDTLISATRDGDDVVYSDPHLGALRWLDAPLVELGDFPDRGQLRHFDVVALDGAVFSFEPRTETIYRVEGGAVTDTLPFTEETAAFPFVPDGERVWVGGSARDGGLVEVARLPDGAVAQAAGEGWIVAVQGEELVVYDSTLAEVGRLAIEALRVPPLRGIDGSLGPLRCLVSGGELVVGNTMRGTIERRALPTLAAVGDDAPVAVGRWAAFPGIR